MAAKIMGSVVRGVLYQLQHVRTSLTLLTTHRSPPLPQFALSLASLAGVCLVRTPAGSVGFRWWNGRSLHTIVGHQPTCLYPLP